MPDRYGFQTIATELDGRILRVTLNRPDRLNALDIVMHDELGELYGKIERDEDVDVVVVTGAGKAFCVGADFSQMEENLARGGYEDGHPGLMTGSARMARSILAVRQPMIAAINGHAIGLGATLALFCDIVFMAEGARIGDPHVKAGIVAGDGGPVLWPMLVGANRAKEYLIRAMARLHGERELALALGELQRRRREGLGAVRADEHLALRQRFGVELLHDGLPE